MGRSFEKLQSDSQGVRWMVRRVRKNNKRYRRKVLGRLEGYHTEWSQWFTDEARVHFGGRLAGIEIKIGDHKELVTLPEFGTMVKELWKEL